jgi:hypothetical protein
MDHHHHDREIEIPLQTGYQRQYKLNGSLLFAKEFNFAPMMNKTIMIIYK